jgi:hypothetical protein
MKTVLTPEHRERVVSSVRAKHGNHYVYGWSLSNPVSSVALGGSESDIIHICNNGETYSDWRRTVHVIERGGRMNVLDPE